MRIKPNIVNDVPQKPKIDNFGSLKFTASLCLKKRSSICSVHLKKVYNNSENPVPGCARRQLGDGEVVDPPRCQAEQA